MKRLADPQQLRIAGIDADGKTELPAQLQSRHVLGQRLADQCIDAALPRQLDQTCRHQVAKPVPFPVAKQGNGKFGSAVVGVSGNRATSSTSSAQGLP